LPRSGGLSLKLTQPACCARRITARQAAGSPASRPVSLSSSFLASCPMAVASTMYALRSREQTLQQMQSPLIRNGSARGQLPRSGGLSLKLTQPACCARRITARPSCPMAVASTMYALRSREQTLQQMQSPLVRISHVLLRLTGPNFWIRNGSARGQLPRSGGLSLKLTQPFYSPVGDRPAGLDDATQNETAGRRSCRLSGGDAVLRLTGPNFWIRNGSARGQLPRSGGLSLKLTQPACNLARSA
jgi:hypothetical protein